MWVGCRPSERPYSQAILANGNRVRQQSCRRETEFASNLVDGKPSSPAILSTTAKCGDRTVSDGLTRLNTDCLRPVRWSALFLQRTTARVRLFVASEVECVILAAEDSEGAIVCVLRGGVRNSYSVRQRGCDGSPAVRCNSISRLDMGGVARRVRWQRWMSSETQLRRR